MHRLCFIYMSPNLPPAIPSFCASEGHLLCCAHIYILYYIVYYIILYITYNYVIIYITYNYYYNYIINILWWSIYHHNVCYNMYVLMIGKPDLTQIYNIFK